MYKHTERSKTIQQNSREKILTTFHKLNPEYEVDAGKLDLIFVIGDTLSGSWPEMPKSIQRTALSMCNFNTAEKEIGNVKAAIQKLQTTLSAIHSTTLLSLVHADIHIEELEKLLIATIDKANNAKETIQRLKIDPKVIKDHPKFFAKKSGRPQNRGALYIAEILADEYYRATGKMPTFSNRLIQINLYKKGYKKHGEFLNLVKSVFDILEITASPEAMSRQANNLWRKRKAAVESKGEKSLKKEN